MNSIANRSTVGTDNFVKSLSDSGREDTGAHRYRAYGRGKQSPVAVDRLPTRFHHAIDMSRLVKLAADPWRVFFPLGIVMLVVGVSHWLLLRLHWTSDAGSAFHAIAQVDGFLWCFVLGFLFTMLPRRTQSAPPSRSDLAIGLVVPLLAVGLARAGHFALSQSVWLVGCIAVLVFVVRRLRHGGRRAPVAFVWLAIAPIVGLLGALATGFGHALPAWFEGHRLGKLLVTQGMVIAWIVGAGAIAVPLLTRGESPPDAPVDGEAMPALLAHGFAASLLVGSFLFEVYISPSLGYATRAVLTMAMLLLVGGIHRPPSLPGWNRRQVFVAAWCVPIGYALAALIPTRPQIGLHTALFGCAALALSVGLHVALSHSGKREAAASSAMSAAAVPSLLLLSLALRWSAEIAPQYWLTGVGLASAGFLLAVGAWGWRARPAWSRR